MQVNLPNSLKSIIGGIILFIVPTNFFWIRPAVAQPNPNSTVVLPSAIPGDSRPVMILGGIESVDQVRDTNPGGAGGDGRTAPGDDIPVPGPRRGGHASAEGPRGGLGGASQEPRRGPISRREDQESQRPRGFGGRNAPQPPAGPGPMGTPAVPGHWPAPPMMRGPAGSPFDFDQLMGSPVLQKMLAMMQENMELKAQIKIQSIESEFKLREREFESKLQDMRRQLEFSQVELKEERIAKERLEKRIAELDHRSRLLEERARAIGSQAAQKIDPEVLKRAAMDLHRQFEEKVTRSKHDSDQGDAKKSDDRKQEAKQNDKSPRNPKGRNSDDDSKGKRSFWSDVNEPHEKKDSK